MRRVSGIFRLWPISRLALGSMWFLIAAFCWLPLRAQVDTAQTDETTLQRTIEDAMSDLQSDDDADWSVYQDAMQDLKGRPVDLNAATREELLLIPGISELFITNLQAHIARYGKLTSLYEVQAVPGMTRELFDQIKPFIKVASVGEKDIKSGQMHPAGPAFRDIIADGRHEFTLRWISTLEQEKGYTAPDTNSDGSLTSRYEGNPWKVYGRYRMRYNQNVSIGVLGEKDQGEPFRWDPNNGFYGFDFLSAHAFIKNYGALKRLAVGDYTIQAGQGLILSSGLGFGKGAEAINVVKRPGLGIRPFSSVNENQSYRGGAATVAVKKFYFTGFFSRMGIDANISAVDTNSQEVQQVSSLQTSGTHRTLSEISDKDAIQETLMGGRVEYKGRKLMLGATQMFQQFSSVLLPGGDDYQYYDFSGNRNMLTGLDWDFTHRNLNFFGEAARSLSGGTAITAGMLASLDRRMDVSLQVRNFEKDFHSTRGYAFSERPVNIQNERGVYMGIKVMPTTKWTISGFLDQYWFPWNRFGVSFPSRGWDYLVQVDFKPDRNTTIYVRWRSDHKQDDATQTGDDGQQIEFIVPYSNQHLRFHFDQKIGRNLRLKSRAELSWYDREDQEPARGFTLYQDISYKLGWKWDITARYAIFDAEDYDARIYAYENDIPGVFSIPAYYGKGSRFYVMLNFKPTRHLEFWLRFAQSRYPNLDIISSGLTEIQGNTKSELKFQVRYSF